ncbi:unnamed protein product [Owenia fusiformis]|uniref:Centrosome and spindle pole-associated protein 1 n=1 Tax=Owenia fusiformis TaxID=6347 RepID=A0A8S4MYZ9_OWEFU|nr:unnamed protein product [Owenia fusiformis]
MADDLEAFIAEQKAKLARERTTIGPKTDPPKDRQNLEYVNPGPQKPQRKQWGQKENPDISNLRRNESPQETGLKLGGFNDAKRKELQEERKREYNELKNQNSPQTATNPSYKSSPQQAAPTPSTTLIVGDDQHTLKQQLQKERQLEYNSLKGDFYGKPRREYRARETPAENKLLQLGEHEAKHKKIEDERHLEFLKTIQEKDPRKNQNESQSRRGNNENTYQNQQSFLNDPRQNDINRYPDQSSLGVEQMQENDSYNTQFTPKSKMNGHVPNKENVTPDHDLFSKLGNQSDDKKRKLQEERKKEYNAMISEQAVRSGRINDDTTGYTTTLPGMKERNSAQVRQERRSEERKHDYQDYLQSEQERLRHRLDGKKPPPGGQAGFEDTRSAGVPSSRERERDVSFYQDRDREQNIPRYPLEREPGQRPGPNDSFEASLPGLRDHPSAEARKIRERNNEYQLYQRGQLEQDYLRRQGASYRDNRPLDSNIVLDPRDPRYYEDERLPPQYRREPPRKGWGTPTYEEILDKKRREERAYRRGDDPGLHGGLRTSISDGNLYKTFEDDQRLKELDKEYESKRVRFQDELLGRRGITSILDDKKWLEFEDARKERPRSYHASRRYDPDPETEFSNWDANRNRGGLSDRGSRRDYDDRGRANSTGNVAATLPIGGEDRDSAKQRRKQEYRRDLEQQIAEQQQSKRSPRRDTYNDRGRSDPQPPVRPQGGGILERGWDGIYDKYSDGTPKNTSLLNKNGYLNAGGQPSLGAYNSPLDEAYYYYGLKDPLDPTTTAEGAAFAGRTGPADIPRLNLQDDRTSRKAPPGGTSNVGFAFPSDDDRRSKSRNEKMSYQEELARQVQEKEQRKQREKEDKARYDRKLEKEIEDYNPFGRGGAGAPMKDIAGNNIADLRKMHLVNEENLVSPRKVGIEAAASAYQEKPAYQPTFNSSPRAIKEDTYQAGTGSNGFFGEQATSNQSATEKYKAELQRQIDEKKAREAEEKEKQRIEEEKEQKRLDEQQKRIQAEYEEEKRKKKEKEDEEKRKNEELKQLAEERKKEAEMKRQELEDRRQEELRQQQERDLQQRIQNSDPERLKSPPIPTLRAKNEDSGKGQSPRLNSPVIPALRPRSTRSRGDPQPQVNSGRTSPPVPAVNTQTRSQSADVLNQLANLKAQLQSEKTRVQHALDDRKNDVEVYDPRLMERPPNQAIPKDNQVDIFDIASHRKPVSVRRSADPNNRNNLEEFKKLKKDARESPKDYLDLNPRSIGLIREDTPGSMLDAETAYVGVDNSASGFPDDFENLGRRNESARQKRRNKYDSSPRATPRQPSPYTNLDNISLGTNMGSTTSIDPDRITRKNEERLRKLKTLAGDEISVGDPDDILDRFMAKQTHNRPPSGATLQDDSWMRPGSNTAYR